MSHQVSHQAYSVSRIETFRQCPRLYDAIYNKGLRQPDSDALVFGRVIHETLERWHSPHVQHGPDDSIIDLYNVVWRESLLTNFELYTTGKHMLESYIANPAHYAHEILAVELEFGMNNDGPRIGDYTLMGVIDRIDKVDDHTLELIDYKTGVYGYDVSEASAKLQLLYYSYVVKQLLPQYRYHRVVYHYLRYGRLELGTIDTELPGVYDELIQFVTNLIYQIEHTTEWTPKVNTFCPTCHVRHDCPAYRAAVDRGEIPQVENTGDLTMLWRRREELDYYAKMISEARNTIDTVMKAWMQEHQLSSVPLDDDSGELILEPYKSSKYPFDVVLALVGADKIERFVSVRKGDVDQYFKNNPEAMAILQASTVVTFGKPMLRFVPKRMVKVTQDGESVHATKSENPPYRTRKKAGRTKVS